MSFDYPNKINALNQADKTKFYRLLARELTVVNRATWSDAQATETERTDRLKWLNEIMHRVLNRLIDLSDEGESWTDQEVWDLIKQHVAQNKAISDEVSWAIKRSYEQVLAQRVQPAQV